MKNLFERIPFIYSFQQKDGFDFSPEELDFTSGCLTYRDNGLTSESMDYRENTLTSSSLTSSENDLTSSSLTSSENDLTSDSLAYRESDLTDNLPEDDSVSNGTEKEVDPESKLSIYSLEEISYHDSFDDCWIILYDKVYDITRFLQEHPGGEDVLMDYAGRDATISFRSVGHSMGALKALEEYLIGILPDRQRLFPSDSETRWSIA